MKIYTRTGDEGMTGLIDGSRVSKDNLRVAAYGDVDELNAVLGVVKAHSHDKALNKLLHQVQRDLFALGAQLADPKAKVGTRKAKAAFPASHVKKLERAIDKRDAGLPPLASFILPGGSALGSFLHLARTVCRRAERTSISLSHQQQIEPIFVVYLNRLSDLLFVLARHANQTGGVPEDRW
jgi:cob(I)alamin adenosyltransferase